MNYGKMLDLFDLAMKMQESSDGISLADICRDFDVSQRTAERMRDALLRYFPQMEEVYTGEKKKTLADSSTDFKFLNCVFSGRNFSPANGNKLP